LGKEQAKQEPLYDPDCPVAAALDVIGDRWTLLIVRDLLRRQARRFQDLEGSLKGISPNTLSARLKGLEEAGVVERRFYAEHPPRAEYVLTEKGRALGPIMLALKRWGEAYGGQTGQKRPG
jgi:DNA-binding HxlR family transcriptional regulator